MARIAGRLAATPDPAMRWDAGVGSAGRRGQRRREGAQVPAHAGVG